MVLKQRVALAAIGLPFILFLSSADALAQCSRGGSAMPSGSTTALNSSTPYSSNPLALNYPQSSQLMALQYQQRALQIQNQAMALAYQNAQRQRLAMLARNQQARPSRIARAEATRAARAERIARLAERYKNSNSSPSDVYMYTSTIASP